MLSFLKRAGVILGKVIGAVAGVSPNILSLISQYNEAYGAKAQAVVDRFQAILQKALDVEVAFAAVYPNAKTGPQKLQALTALIAPIIAEIETIKGREVANAALYNEGLTDIANGTAKILNAIKGGTV